MLQSVAHFLSANVELSNFKSQEQALAGNFQLYRLLQIRYFKTWEISAHVGEVKGETKI